MEKDVVLEAFKKIVDSTVNVDPYKKIFINNYITSVGKLKDLLVLRNQFALVCSDLKELADINLDEYNIYLELSKQIKQERDLIEGMEAQMKKVLLGE